MRRTALPFGFSAVFLLLPIACSGGDSHRSVGASDAGTGGSGIFDAAASSGGRSSGGATNGGGGVTSTGGSAGGGTSAGGASGGSSAGGSDSGVGGAASGGAPVDGGLGGASATDASLDGANAPDAQGGSSCSPDASIQCLGVCAATEPVCDHGVLRCTGPGFEAVETTCDGFDNDCDGTIDEGCPACTVDLARVQANLTSMFDIDFDAQCNTYLTTITSGPDHTTVVPADPQGAVRSYSGNANQNMGFGLVDPDPAENRVVVAYSCCEACNCQAKNGLTLLYTCSAATSGCGCAGQTNCPGFLDAPFFATGTKDTSVTVAGYKVATPTGLAAGPGSTYYVGNFEPEACSSAATCTPCDPEHPGVWCSASNVACCRAGGPLGRVAQFTTGASGKPAEFRLVAEFGGEEVLGLTASRDGSVLVGTSTGVGSGVLRRVSPNGDATIVRAMSGPVYSVAENRTNGDIYVELLNGPRINRIDPLTGALLVLPAEVPSPLLDDGVLQYGPDGKLYRLSGVVGGASQLSVYSLD